MAERVLSRRELNRGLLARQQLLAPAEVALPRVLHRVGGIQAQCAPSITSACGRAPPGWPART